MRLGADPEVFLKKAEKHTAICGLLNADKWNPMQVPTLPKGFTYQEDNVALEFGVPPAATEDEFVNNILLVQEQFLKDYQQFTFSKLSAVVFLNSQLKHPGARVFGCEPDYNAWTKEVNPKPECPNPSLRSAGGHIHVETKLDPTEVVKAMDICLGVPSVLMDITGADRRMLYGKAGAMRIKPYGVEYRTLSNFWIFKEKYIRWVWRATRQALDTVKHQENWKVLSSDLTTTVQNCINGSSTTDAKYLVKMLNLEVV